MLKRLFILCLAGLIVWGGVKTIFDIFPANYMEEIKEFSQKNGLEPSLVLAQIKAESGFNHNAKSKKGALGLMQVMPETGTWCAKKLNISDFEENSLFIPKINIEIGCWYLSYLLSKTDSIEWALASYNAGLSNVQKWKESGIHTIEDIPFPETKTYVKKVLGYKKIYENLYKKELKS
ncbi:MAG: lytic transglycosylase domain-containing protein [Clostridia bacterium]|nr:lytic transglycosylase domain-containing protein [Clostridia bacterium]